MLFSKNLSVLLLLPILSIFSLNDEEIAWELVIEEDEIQVYTRSSETSKLKEIRIVASFETTLSEFMERLNDANNYTDWVYKCGESQLLERVDENVFYYYVTTDLPFPASDRDLVVICKQWQDEDGTIYTSSKGVPSFIDHKEKFVRIPFYQSNWKISETENGIVQIDYTSVSDPGGWIPIWIVNLALTSGPLKTMKQLKKLIES